VNLTAISSRWLSTAGFGVGLLLVGVTGAAAQCVNVRAQGAVGDGKADDSVAVQAAIRIASVNRRGGTVCVPAGDYRITQTITVSDVQGIRVIGEGGATRLLWAGDDKSPLLLLSSVQDGEFRGFQIIGNDQQPLSVGIQSLTAASARFVSRHNTFVAIRVDGVTSGVRVGFRIGGGVDANNDFHHFEDVTVANYRDVAYSLENTQVYGITFVNCLFEGGSKGQVGVATDRAAGKGGNFAWIGGGGGNNQMADFSFGDPNNGVISITDAVFESSARFLKTGGPSGASFLLRVEGIRWAGDALAPDGIAIDFRFPGPLSIRNSRFGEDSSKALTISWKPGGPSESPVFVFEGNVVKRAPGTSLFVGRQPTRSTDNIVY